jgi:hypothetical protein
MHAGLVVGELEGAESPFLVRDEQQRGDWGRTSFKL